MKKETFRDIAESLQAVPMDDTRIDRLSGVVTRTNEAVRVAAGGLPVIAEPSGFLAVIEREKEKAR